MDKATEAAFKRWMDAKAALASANAKVAAAANLFLAGKESRETLALYSGRADAATKAVDEAFAAYDGSEARRARSAQ